MSRAMRKLAVLVLVACACGGSRSAPGQLAGQGAAVPDKPEPAAPVGVDTITAADLRAHVELLASDEYAGRETLTRGAEMAADYLSKEFARYGLVPMPGRDSFKVPYTLEQYGYAPEANKIDLESASGDVSLALGVDYTPFNFSDSGEVKGAEVVFAGYGITAPKLGWDDYKGLDVEGKVVLVLRHWPHEENEADNKFAEGPFGQFLVKARNAQEHGAVGMLLVTDPKNHDAKEDDFEPPLVVRLPRTDEEKARAAKMREAREKARTAGKRPRSRRGKGPKPADKLLAAHISQAAAEALVPGLREIQKKLDAGTLEAAAVRLEAQATMAVQSADQPTQVTPSNVVGFLPGADPKKKHEWIVIGGHYDHLGQAGKDDDNIYNGADDNASGTAGVLELAQAFASLPSRPSRSIVFIGFSGEEKGLLGSFAMLRQKQLPEERLVFMLNLDMIGRNPSRPVEVVGDAYASRLRPILDAANKSLGLDIDFAGTRYAGNSDHHPFFKRDIPMMFFFTGTHEDYHQRSDHADKLSYDRMEKIVRLGYAVIEPLAGGAVTPSFIHHLNWLGVTIEIAGGEAVITSVAGDSRAARAGVAKGDAVVAIGGKALARARDVGRRFRELEPGTRTTLELRRAGATRTVEVVRAKRGFLGVYPGRITDEVRKKHGLAAKEGLLIRATVPEGPAAKAGFQKGDILIRIAGVPVGMGSLGRHLARIGAGEKVAVVVIRGDKRVDLTMVLGER